MYERAKNGWLKHWDFILSDILMAFVGLMAVFSFHFHSIDIWSTFLFREVVIVFLGIDFLGILMFDIYNNVLQRQMKTELITIFLQVAWMEIVIILYMRIQSIWQYISMEILWQVGAFYMLLGIPSREILKKVVKRKNKKGGDVALYIVTTSREAPEIIQNIQEHNNRRYLIQGLILLDKGPDIIKGVPVVADKETAVSFLQKAWVDELLINASEECFPAELKEQSIMMGIAVHTKIPGSLDMDAGTQFIQRVGSQTVLTSSINSMSVMQAAIKRAVDIAGGIVGCLITVGLFCIVAPFIYIRSPGPIIFSQTRVGKNGKKFKIYKFRSMYMDAEERKKELMDQNRIDGGYMFKMDFDPRVIGNRELPGGKRKTGIGDFIRRTSIDEFPQFFNVLKGEMSLVGTRPPTVEEVERYDLHHKKRLSTKPGITGLWQISGRSRITNFEQVVELDTYYIKNWSLALDAKILLKTVKEVISRSGSM